MNDMVKPDQDEVKPEDQIIQEDTGINVHELAGVYNKTVTDLSDHIDQQEVNYNIRHCIWSGQSEDGRKHARTNGNKPFPWDGASDLKVPTIDEIINHGVAMDVLALAKANIRGVAVEGGDLAKAAVVSNFMRWLVMSQMTELSDEAEVLSNYRRERGIGLLGIYWESKVQKTQQKISLAEVEQAYPDIAAAIKQGVFIEEVTKLVVQLLKGTVSTKKAKAMIKELRTTGETTVPVVVQQVNRPMVKAYAIGEDVFLPPNTANNPQSARHIFVRSFMSPEELREKVISEKWDVEYIEDAIEHGMGSNGTAQTEANGAARSGALRVGVSGSESLYDGLIEVVRAYQRLSDEDGVPGIYCTIFCPACHTSEDDADSYAKHELLGYKNGLYPFVPFKRENISRLLLDSRGVPEVGKCWQEATKVEMDSRIDGASLATVPPRRGPVGREPGNFSPGSYVGERRPGEYGFLEIPPPPSASVEVQQRLEYVTRKYFGRPVNDDTSGEWQVKQQKDTQTWLKGWQQVFRMIWDLYDQYGPDEEWFRVIGANSDKAQKFAKKDFSGKYDFYLAFDVMNMDPEAFAQKIDMMGKLGQQYDKTGQMNWGEFLAATFEMIDPVLAERFIIPQEVASQKEVSDTHRDISLMAAGIDLDVPQVGVNAELRMQVIQGWVKGAEDNPATDVQQRLQGDEALRNRIEKYTKQLQFQSDQRKNAVIGRMGTAPAGATG